MTRSRAISGTYCSVLQLPAKPNPLPPSRHGKGEQTLLPCRMRYEARAATFPWPSRFRPRLAQPLQVEEESRVPARSRSAGSDYGREHGNTNGLRLLGSGALNPGHPDARLSARTYGPVGPSAGPGQRFGRRRASHAARQPRCRQNHRSPSMNAVIHRELPSPRRITGCRSPQYAHLTDRSWLAPPRPLALRCRLRSVTVPI